MYSLSKSELSQFLKVLSSYSVPGTALNLDPVIKYIICLVIHRDDYGRGSQLRLDS